MEENTYQCSIEFLSQKWIELLTKYTENSSFITNSFHKILSHYNSTKKHYHNLLHICKMLHSAEKFRTSTKQFDLLLFAVWYHDIVYNPLKNNNEEKSASFAVSELQKINFPYNKSVSEMILRTKNHFFHTENESPELELLLDLDLEMLGSEPEIYLINTLNIRKEYSIYPDSVFNKGRTKVLEQFLNSESIYRTKFFKDNYEKQARINISEELKSMATSK